MGERKAAHQASLQAAMELLQLEEGSKGGKTTENSRGAGGQDEQQGGGGGVKERQKRKKREAAREAVGELRDAEARASKDDGDEIDAEFNRRVLEHLRSRAEEAKKNGTHAQTERGNTILKALCKKLTAQLEEVDAPANGRGGQPNQSGRTRNDKLGDIDAMLPQVESAPAECSAPACRTPSAQDL